MTPASSQQQQQQQLHLACIQVCNSDGGSGLHREAQRQVDVTVGSYTNGSRRICSADSLLKEGRVTFLNKC